MRRLAVISALLLGLIGAASGFRIGSATPPEFPASVDGCNPATHISHAECPSKMICFADTNYPNGGRCDCDSFIIRFQAKLPFVPTSEWDDGFSNEDCENVGFVQFMYAMLNLTAIVMCCALMYTSFVVIKELVRAKAFKFNATGRSLILLFYIGLVNIGLNLTIGLNLAGADKTGFWFSSRTSFYTLMIPFAVFVDFEIALTWIDLYDRTNKMSKSTTKTVKTLRVVTRILQVCLTGVYLWLSSQNGRIAFLFSLAVPPIAGAIFVSIGGRLITKTLCPDRKDVANPNWKVAEAIRRGVRHAVGTQIVAILMCIGAGVVGKHPLLSYSYTYFANVWYCCFIFRLWGWLHYLIYGSRKHLTKYANENASAYFGFSTIGLNKTLTTASSRMSSSVRSSVVSSRSSAAD